MNQRRMTAYAKPKTVGGMTYPCCRSQMVRMLPVVVDRALHVVIEGGDQVAQL